MAPVRRPAAVRSAAERLLDELLKDPALVAHVAAQAIDEKLASGELVKAERLVFSGMTLVPTDEVDTLKARIAELDGAIDDALASIDDGKVSAAVAALEATIPESELDVDEPGPGNAREPEPPAADPEPGPEPDPEPLDGAPEAEPSPEPEEPEPAAEPKDGRGPGWMPNKDIEHPCEGDECHAMVPGPNAQVTYVRFRNRETGKGLVLCKDCLTKYDPPK